VFDDSDQIDRSNTDFEPERVKQLFQPLRDAFEALWPLGASDGQDVMTLDVGRRRATCRLAITAIGYWEAIALSAGIDLSQPGPGRSDDSERRQHHGVSLYSDGMFTYHLLDSITAWNGLEHSTSDRPDDLDVELARALIRFLDLAGGVDWYTDVRKRSEEAVGNTLVAMPQLLNEMLLESDHRAFFDELESSIRGMAARADSIRDGDS
jgi:hypothetical protein